MVEIKVGDNILATYEYAEGNGNLSEISYANGYGLSYIYDYLDELSFET